MSSPISTPVSDSLTKEKVIQAFDKIKGKFTVKGGRLELITEDRFADACEIMANNFVPDEPLCQAFGVVWHPAFEKVVRATLGENISVMMVSNDTNEVMGIRTNGIMKRNDVTDSGVDYENLGELFKFLTHKEKEVGFFDRFGLDEALHFYTLGVNKKYRRMGIGTTLMGACIAFTRELGFRAIKGEGTSNFSQRIYERYGFEVLDTMPYDTYMYKGQHIVNGTGEHKMTKIYGIKL